MDNLTVLESLQNRAKQRAEGALTKNDFSAAVRYSKLADECKDILENVRTLSQRIAAELENPTNVAPAISRGAFPAPLTASTASLSRKALGKKARQDWAKGKAQAGIQLVQADEGGKNYRTRSHNLVAIAYASELDIRPGRWFLGLPDEEVDTVVLLCKEQSGRMLDFILPPDFVDQVQQDLSRSNGQVKLNVVRYGANYELLLPGRQRKSITQYLGQDACLR